MTTRNPNLNITPLLKKAAAANGAIAAEAAAAETAADAELVGPRGAWWWTGLEPSACPGFDKKSGVLRSLPLPNTASFTRQQVLDYFDNCWTLSETLFACLQGREAFVRQPYHQLRHPMMFYYVHPAVLYINKFRVAGLLDDGIDQYMEQLFETGVDEMSWDDLSQGTEEWPSVRAAHAYRAKAYKVIRGALETHACLDERPVGWNSAAWAVFMGFEHERIHIETSSVLIRELPLAFVRRPEHWPAYHPSASLPSAASPTEGSDYPANRLLEVAGEKVVLGKALGYPSFGWDNEYGSKAIQVAPFRASMHKVTNGEFHAFVRAGGYSSPQYWSEDGWGWRTFRNVKWPTFWVPDGPAGLHRYKLRCLFDAISMRWDWPVDANYHEAQAYLRWRTEVDGQVVAYRMITEAEHNLLRNEHDRVDAHRFAQAKKPVSNGMHANGYSNGFASANANGHANGAVSNGHGVVGNGAAAAQKSPGSYIEAAEVDADLNPDAVMQCSGSNALQTVGFNFQLAYSSQSPVDALPSSSKGFRDTFGSAWEWGEDHFAALPGFRVHPYYDDFSAPCFAGLHQMIIGGSFISTGQLASKYARYQFRGHFFQHASFRIVQSAVDLTQYDTSSASPSTPILPFFETSCMDGAPPHVGDGPCCSKTRRDRFTLTMAEERAKSAQIVEATKASYETDALLAQYISLHFGPVEAAFSEFLQETGLLSHALDFPKKCGDIVNDWSAKANVHCGRALDLGCAVGRSTFEMARQFQEVVGIDLSQRFIDTAEHMRTQRCIEYELKVEGDIAEPAVARVDPAIDTSRLAFLQGDACQLPTSLGTFDAVLAANLLCRVPNPRACLAGISARTNPGGLLVLTSPFTWLEDYTERANWLGATVGAAGVAVRCGEALKEELGKLGYDVLEEGKIPLVIRETSRKYQLILAHKLVAQKRRSA